MCSSAHVNLLAWFLLYWGFHIGTVLTMLCYRWSCDIVCSFCICTRELVKVWSALTLLGSYNGCLCVFHVEQVNNTASLIVVCTLGHSQFFNIAHWSIEKLGLAWGRGCLLPYIPSRESTSFNHFWCTLLHHQPLLFSTISLLLQMSASLLSLAVSSRTYQFHSHDISITD